MSFAFFRRCHCLRIVDSVDFTNARQPRKSPDNEKSTPRIVGLSVGRLAGTTTPGQVGAGTVVASIRRLCSRIVVFLRFLACFGIVVRSVRGAATSDRRSVSDSQA